jgi:hypothetical protein
MSRRPIIIALAALGCVMLVSFNLVPERYRDRALVKCGLKPMWEKETKEAEGNNYYSKRNELTLLSPIFHIDKIYRSMTGPVAKYKEMPFDNYPDPQLLWLTDYSLQVTNETGGRVISNDFMCHNNLDLPIGKYVKEFGIDGSNDAYNSRFATLTEGQTRINFPEGFGVPFFSTDSVVIVAQALNHNLSPVDLDVRHKIKMGYVADADVTIPLRPLFKRTVFIELPVAEKGHDMAEAKCDMKDCSPTAASIKTVKARADGRKYSSHWNIRDGRDTFRCDVTKWMYLKENTMLHYANVHLHPYAVSLTLRDVTEGKDVFTSYVENYKGKTGMHKIGHYSSTEGTQLYKDHKYELVCVSNNTSHKEQDMMAVMILYIEDSELDKGVADIRARGKMKTAAN